MDFPYRASTAFIRIYQLAAPQFVRNSCRHEPSCSSYALLALKKYGVWRGWWMAIKRIVRCRPPYGGIDYP